MKVMGAGLGRTGTYSLKLALEQLGFGPSHHMEEVLHHMSTQVPLWNKALNGQPDWSAIYKGYVSAVDWPTARFYKELHEAYPDAKFILTYRDPESWASSFGSTIYELLKNRHQAPPDMQNWLDMAFRTVQQNGFPAGLGHEDLRTAYEAHNQAVKRTIPESQLLLFQVKQGWKPLCDFLNVPVPDSPFPNTNNRNEFWEMITGSD